MNRERSFTIKDLGRINNFLDQMKRTKNRKQLWEYIYNAQIATFSKGDDSLASSDATISITQMFRDGETPSQEDLFIFAAELAAAAKSNGKH